jgi:lipopolysaccharide biosynthesis glycosyltransferase
MYYQFDYQKVIIWNLRYEQVMFIDADMMIGENPGSVFALCGTHPLCAVQDPGAHGGYFNNGVFVMNCKLEIIEELLHSWWKDSPPWRQIAMQDIMNEVFAKRWKPLPEVYNFQGMKHGHQFNACGAQFVHYKGCHERKENPFCKYYLKQREEAAEKFPELFNYQFKH